MTNAEKIRAVILRLIDIEERVYDMTNENFNSVTELREALLMIRETNQILKKASYIESEKQPLFPKR